MKRLAGTLSDAIEDDSDESRRKVSSHTFSHLLYGHLLYYDVDVDEHDD